MATGSFKLPISSGGDEWVRPSDWLPMPTGITSADQTFVGLHAIFPEGNNFCSFRFNTSAGQYRVDWGDGVIDLVNSGSNAIHEYNYATYDTSNSTLCSRGYKQAMVVVTAVSGNLTFCSFQISYPSTPTQTTTYASGFLDCILSMPNATSGSSILFGNGVPAHRYVERVYIKTIGGCTNLQGFFASCSSLQSVPLFNTTNVTDMRSMFINCSSLKSVPLFNTGNVILMQSIFQNCSSLESVPLFNTQNVTNMGNMFNSCASLRSVPLFNTANVVITQSMFSSCARLQSLPLFNTANVNNMSSMIIGCSSLNSIPAFSTASITTTSGTDYSGFAQGCNSLYRIPMVFSRTINIQDCQLSRTALVEIFNNLVDRTATTSATINIFRNWGASALTAGERAIATGKNWLITG